MSRTPYFLPYQVAWLQDTSRYKICEKSRRIGMTYVQSYEDVRDAARADGMDVWFSSADESAAREYILYCKQWAKLFDAAARDLGEIVLNRDDDVKVLAIEFASGKRINALTSNPTRFNSKGGKVVLDEFAKHKDQDGMWKAAQPVTVRGFPMRIISTYEGRGNRYYRMVQDCKQGKSPWKLHSTTIIDAVNQGLADQIEGRSLTPAEREAWLVQARELAGDEETWQQEYLCNPIDEATAWLTWDLIQSAEHPEAGNPEAYERSRGICYVGMDIARRRDLTVIWVLEKVGDILWTREVVSMKGASFASQQAELDRVFRQYRVMRCCLDQTGMGEVIVEQAQATYGRYRVEGVLFNGAVKQDLAIVGKQKFEDRLLRIPVDKAIRESHHAIRKVTTAAGNPRFDSDRSEVGHADEYWSHMLAIHAAEGSFVPIDFMALDQPGADLDGFASAYAQQTGAGIREGRGFGVVEAGLDFRGFLRG